MSRPENQAPANPVQAGDAITPVSEAGPVLGDIDSKSSMSVDGEKDAKLSSHAAPINVVPHLSGTSDDDVTLIDAQSGAVGATWKHRLPALLMILFFTRKSSVSLPPLYCQSGLTIDYPSLASMSLQSEATSLSPPSLRSSRPSRRRFRTLPTRATAPSPRPTSWSTASCPSSPAS